MARTANHRATPPAYQEYASDMLASLWFRTMTMHDRGLLWTLRMECWVNGDLPSEPAVLARLLGADTGDLNRFLDSRAFATFARVSDGRITFPDLETYRGRVVERREVRRVAANKMNAKRAAQRDVERNV